MKLRIKQEPLAPECMTPSTSYFTAKLPAAFLLALAALATSPAIPPCHAGPCKVVVVKSADLQPYRDVVRGIRDSSECSVRETILRGEEGREKVLLMSPDIVISIGTTAFKKVRTIEHLPVIHVMAMPSEAALSANPNISGVSMDLSPENSVASLRDVFPGARRIGILYDPRHTAAFFEGAVKTLRGAGMEVVSRQVHDPSKVPAALAGLSGKIDLFWMLADPTVLTAENIDFLLSFSFQQTVPIFTFSEKYVEMGAVASVDVDPYDMGAQAAGIANKLAASQPGPFREYAHTSHLTINRNVAKKMGLKIRNDFQEKGKRIE